MIYNLSHKHSKGDFGEEKTMDQNPDGIVSKKYNTQEPFDLLSVKNGEFSFRVDSSLDLWTTCYWAAKKHKQCSYHADPDYKYHPAGTVLTFTQE